MDDEPKLLLSQRFTSFEELAASVVAWDLDFRQASKNYSDTTLQQIQVGEMLVSHLTCGCFATHAGATPKGMVTVAVPDPDCSEFRYSGHPVDRPAMIVTRGGEEFNLNTRPGYGIYTFSIPQSTLEKFCETRSDFSLDRLQGVRSELIFADPDLCLNLTLTARAASLSAHQLSTLPDSPGSVPSLESYLLERLFNSLPDGNRIRQEPGVSAQGRIFRQALDIIRDHEHEILSVPDLAAAVNTTERTLERVFKRELGLSPKKYLLAQKLYGAHRQLWRSSSSKMSVADIANAWGFWHIGQFAKDYRNFFGELPSETLHRSN